MSSKIINCTTGAEEDVTEEWVGEAQAALAAAAALPVIPRKVSTWRLHVIAELNGLTAQIDTALAALPEPQKTIATIGWNRSFETERAAPLVGALGAALGLTESELDDLFVEAAALPVDAPNPTP
jgi:hypothetical protein